MILKNDRIFVEISNPGEYQGSRFDHLPAIRQIVLDDTHSFLGVERTKNGVGSNGFGLQCGFLWRDETFARAIQNKTGYYPLIGVGKLDLGVDESYNIQQPYPTIAPHITVVRHTERGVEAFSLDDGIARIQRTITLTGLDIVLATTVTNLSDHSYAFEEYCHNFLQFDFSPIDDQYCCTMSYDPVYSVVRGAAEIGRNWYRPTVFEHILGTLALIPATEGSFDQTVVSVEHAKIGTRIQCIDDFGPSKTYHWISPYALCPENYRVCNLAPGEAVDFVRTFTVGYSSSNIPT